MLIWLGRGLLRLALGLLLVALLLLRRGLAASAGIGVHQHVVGGARHVFGIRAQKVGDIALAVEDQQLVHQLVQQHAVVADDNQRARVALVAGGAVRLAGGGEGPHRRFKALGAGDVQVVGGLVEHQQVVSLVHQPGHHRAGALAARKHAERFVLIQPAEQKRAGQVAGLLFEFERGEGPQVLNHGLAEVQVLVGLGEEAHVDLAAQLADAAGGFLLAQQAADERGLARAVGADDPQPLAAFEVHGQVGKQRLAFEAHAQLFGFKHHLVALGLGAEVQLHHVQLGGRLDQVVALVAVQQFLAALGLLGPLSGAELVDEALLALDLGLLLGKGPPLVFEAQLAQLAELLVVARVLDHLAVFELVDLAHHAVQQPAVVADEHHGALVVGQELFEPNAAGDVQVVGGLVQQQDVRLGQQQLAQGQAAALAAGQVAALEGEHVVGEPEPVQGLVDLVVHRVAAAGGHAFF